MSSRQLPQELWAKVIKYLVDMDCTCSGFAQPEGEGKSDWLAKPCLPECGFKAIYSMRLVCRSLNELVMDNKELFSTLNFGEGKSGWRGFGLHKDGGLSPRYRRTSSALPLIRFPSDIDKDQTLRERVIWKSRSHSAARSTMRVC